MPIGQQYGWMDHMMGWGMWMAPWGWLLTLLVIGLLIYALAGRGAQGFSDASRESRVGERKDFETPLDIVKKRYAKGEISREDFEQMKKDLLS
ncbi:SHOCT domain-containing protein [Desulfomonile tiedjei]|uniref:Putative membrane protein n=1 Tax=Desulfomonile tiedjei (strain ATCC 49306 / DSM 6799 / DCB-1) TaxID=706587 RepID=I4C4Z6_DESTA|nr:SHOCT domain-containing protein [Desulfomonile tiedjei]AFM24637.1 putative membrane protein [Desulfomonile tiedjei DSM 6799]